MADFRQILSSTTYNSQVLKITSSTIKQGPRSHDIYIYTYTRYLEPISQFLRAALSDYDINIISPNTIPAYPLKPAPPYKYRKIVRTLNVVSWNIRGLDGRETDVLDLMHQ